MVPGITAAQVQRGSFSTLQTVNAPAGFNMLRAMPDGGLPGNIDWQSLADPTTTTAIYMPARTLAALVKKATTEGLDLLTPALAIARAPPGQTKLLSRRPSANCPSASPMRTTRAAAGDVGARARYARHRPIKRATDRSESWPTPLKPTACCSGSGRRSEFDCRPPRAVVVGVERRGRPSPAFLCRARLNPSFVQCAHCARCHCGQR